MPVYILGALWISVRNETKIASPNIKFVLFGVIILAIVILFKSAVSMSQLEESVFLNWKNTNWYRFE